MNRLGLRSVSPRVLASDKLSDSERETFQRSCDREFVRQIALALKRGDHLPARSSQAA